MSPYAASAPDLTVDDSSTPDAHAIKAAFAKLMNATQRQCHVHSVRTRSLTPARAAEA